MESKPFDPQEHEPITEALAFKPKRLTTPGFEGREARYSRENQEFVVTIAAEDKHVAELDAYAKELRVWLKAIAEEGPVVKKPDPDTEQRLLDGLQQMADDGATESRIAFEARLVESREDKLGPHAAILMRIDPTVSKGHGKSFHGPDVVIVSVVRYAPYPNSRVRVLGITGFAANTGPVVGPAEPRDANHHCRVIGLEASKFTIDAKAGVGHQWKED